MFSKLLNGKKKAASQSTDEKSQHTDNQKDHSKDGGKSNVSLNINEKADEILGGIYSLDEQIEFYSNSLYDPVVNAQQFFSSNNETDIQRNMNTIGKIQTSMDYLLGEKVKANYPSFLKANEGIRSIDAEINDLQTVVKSTEQLIQNIRDTRTQTYAYYASKEDRPMTRQKTPLNKPLVDTAVVSKFTAEDGSGQLVNWLFTAPNDIVRMGVEKKYSDAVGLALRCRAYVANILQVTRGKSSPVAESASAGLAEVEARVPALADDILRSLLKLPLSALFGNTSQYLLLKLLIALGESYYEKAVHGLSLMQEGAFRQMYASADAAVRSSSVIEATNADSIGIAAVDTISHCFFDKLQQTINAFLHLFAGAVDGADSKAIPELVCKLLVRWVKALLKAFAAKIHYQIQSVASEKSSQLLSRCVLDRDSASSSSSSRNGPLLFAVLAIDTAVGIASKVDCIRPSSGPEIRLECSSIVRWMLIAHMTDAISAFADDICRDVAAQIQDDKWICVSATLALSTSSSCIKNALECFVNEISKYRLSEATSRGAVSAASAASDNAVVCLLRIFTVIVKEHQNINVSYFNGDQSECFRSSVTALGKLLPAVFEQIHTVKEDLKIQTKYIPSHKLVKMLVAALQTAKNF